MEFVTIPIVWFPLTAAEFVQNLNVPELVSQDDPICVMGLSKRKCPVLQRTKLRILIIIWIIIEI